MAYDAIDEPADAVKDHMRRDQKFMQAIKEAVTVRKMERLKYLVTQVAKEIYGVITAAVQTAINWCVTKCRELFSNPNASPGS
jgi:hypothetical protein